MAETYQLIVGPAEAEVRLDRYLVRHLPHTWSRTAVQRAIRQGAVTVGGQTAKAHRHLKAGEAVVARIGETPPPDREVPLVPERIPLDVVYEDADVAVINKPPGLVTHPAPGHWTGTLVNALVWHFQQLETRNLELETSHLPRAGIVHRLDKDTSGLLLVAKTELALRMLARQLKARTMGRRYLALVEGHLPLHEGTVDASIGRHLKDRKLMSVRYLGGRQAVTHYRVLKRFDAPLKYSLIEATLETGRTHQIRVHLAHLGHPVLGDATYSRRGAGFWSGLGIARQLLHAYAIRFIHPRTDAPMELTSRIPEDMERWIPGVDVAERVKGGTAS